MFRLLKNIVRPQRKLFYNHINQVNNNLIQINTLFAELVRESEYLKRAKLIIEISDYGKKNDQLVHQIFLDLGKNYVTPYDREDIYGLVKSIKLIGDDLIKISSNVNFYKIHPDAYGFDVFALQVHLLVTDVTYAIDHLKKLKFTKEYLDIIKQIFDKHIESKDTFLMALERLFEESNDLKTLIKTREILKNLERVSYQSKECANFLENLIVKYA
jgi:uncharacterized protein Yka (UPF0111/DUF47 family)